jgi:phosphopantetheinyl transferase (holo-ACP synthase)
VERSGTDKPSVRLHGIAGRVMAAYPGYCIHLALSHSATTAGAVAVVEQGAP